MQNVTIDTDDETEHEVIATSEPSADRLRSEFRKSIQKRQALKAALAERDAKIAELTQDIASLKDSHGAALKTIEGERDTARKELEGLHIARKRGAMLEHVAKEFGKAPALTQALMESLERRPEYDSLEWAPDTVSDKAVKAIVNALRKEYPDEQQRSEPLGGSPGAAGTGARSDSRGSVEKDAEWAAGLAARRSGVKK